MRASLVTSGCVVVALLCLAACGKPKQVGDPSSENTPSSPDEPTKWEGASSHPPDENKPKTGGGSNVTEAPQHRHDVYDKEATEIALKRAARQVKANCGAAKDDSGKAVGPWGKATLQIMLGHNGHSKSITVPSPYQGKPVGNCVEKAFTNLTFPPWGGEDTQIDWEIEVLDPNAPAPK